MLPLSSRVLLNEMQKLRHDVIQAVYHTNNESPDARERVGLQSRNRRRLLFALQDAYRRASFTSFLPVTEFTPPSFLGEF